MEIEPLVSTKYVYQKIIQDNSYWVDDWVDDSVHIANEMYKHGKECDPKIKHRLIRRRETILEC